MYKKLASPDFRVTLNNMQIESGFFVDYYGSEDEHTNRCILTPYGDAAEALADADLTDIIIEIGCDYDYCTLVQGHGYSMDGTENILVKDDMTRLKDTFIQETFLNCSPDEVLRYIFVQCGITEYQLPQKKYERKTVFSVPRMTALQAMEEIKHYWNLEVFYGFIDGIFYWDCEPEQDEIYELDSSNILDLEQSGKIWTAEVVPVPWIRIGQLILVTDSAFYGVARIKTCVIKTKTGEKIDMYIQFTGVEYWLISEILSKTWSKKH